MEENIIQVVLSIQVHLLFGEQGNNQIILGEQGNKQIIFREHGNKRKIIFRNKAILFQENRGPGADFSGEQVPPLGGPLCWAGAPANNPYETHLGCHM